MLPNKCSGTWIELIIIAYSIGHFGGHQKRTSIPPFSPFHRGCTVSRIFSPKLHANIYLTEFQPAAHTPACKHHTIPWQINPHICSAEGREEINFCRLIASSTRAKNVYTRTVRAVCTVTHIAKTFTWAKCTTDPRCCTFFGHFFSFISTYARTAIVVMRPKLAKNESLVMHFWVCAIHWGNTNRWRCTWVSKLLPRISRHGDTLAMSQNRNAAKQAFKASLPDCGYTHVEAWRTRAQ